MPRNIPKRICGRCCDSIACVMALARLMIALPALTAHATAARLSAFRLLLRVAHAGTLNEGLARHVVGNELAQQLVQRHPTASDQFLECVGDRRVRLGPPEEGGNRRQRRECILAGTQTARRSGGRGCWSRPRLVRWLDGLPAG